MRPEMIAALYLGLISLIAICVTAYDKYAAKHLPRRRVRERTLFFLSAMGGSVAMLITMRLIRHKTLHKRFMIGIPLIILGQIALIVSVYFYGEEIRDCFLLALETIKSRLTTQMG